MIYKPHTLTFYPLSQHVNDTTKVLEAPLEGTPFTIDGQLMPYERDKVVFDAVTGVKITNPHQFLCEVADAANVRYNYRAVDTDNIEYAVRGVPNDRKAGGPVLAANHTEIVLDQLQFPTGGA